MKHSEMRFDQCHYGNTTMGYAGVIVGWRWAETEGVNRGERDTERPSQGRHTVTKNKRCDAFPADLAC